MHCEVLFHSEPDFRVVALRVEGPAHTGILDIVIDDCNEFVVVSVKGRHSDSLLEHIIQECEVALRELRGDTDEG